MWSPAVPVCLICLSVVHLPESVVFVEFAGLLPPGCCLLVRQHSGHCRSCGLQTLLFLLMIITSLTNCFLLVDKRTCGCSTASLSITVWFQLRVLCATGMTDISSGARALQGAGAGSIAGHFERTQSIAEMETKKLSFDVNMLHQFPRVADQVKHGTSCFAVFFLCYCSSCFAVLCVCVIAHMLCRVQACMR